MPRNISARPTLPIRNLHGSQVVLGSLGVPLAAFRGQRVSGPPKCVWCIKFEHINSESNYFHVGPFAPPPPPKGLRVSRSAAEIFELSESFSHASKNSYVYTNPLMGGKGHSEKATTRNLISHFPSVEKKGSPNCLLSSSECIVE